ncbi:MAG: DMT family transporter [Propionicimonas sp.]
MTARALRPFGFLAGTVLLWGTSFAVTKTAYQSFPPMYVIWLRMLVGLTAFLAVAGRVRRPDYRRGDWKYLALSATFIPCLYYWLEGFAIRFTTSSQAGVVAAVMPLLVAAGAWVFFGQRPTARAAVALGASILGVAALSLGGLAQENAPQPLLGNLLELGAMLAAAGSTLTIKHLSSRYDPWLLTGLQLAVGSVFFAPLALRSEPVDWSAIPPQAWLAVAYLGACCGLLAFGLYNSALKLIPATQAALTINLVPAVAMLTGWIVLGEVMTPVQIAASLLIVAAVTWAQTGNNAQPTPTAPANVRPTRRAGRTAPETTEPLRDSARADTV